MSIRVAMVQMEIAFADPDTNRRRAAEWIAKAARQGADVVVLPETWNVGFFPENAAELADPDGEPGRSLLAQGARQNRVHVIGGSLAELQGGEVYNTTYVFDRQGRQVSHYRKTHLFTFAGENDYFQAGHETGLFELDGVRFGHTICYDIRFPELLRTLALDGAQVVVAPAEWPLKRLDHWRILLRARAIENQFFMVGVNASGTNGKGLQWAGHSACIDPWGVYLAEAGQGEDLLVAELDLSMVREIRETLNVFRDRRPELYRLNRRFPGDSGE